MKTPLTLTLTLSAIACLAQPAPRALPAPGAGQGPLTAKLAPQTPRAIDPAARSNTLAKTGGILSTPASGPSILFLNTQKRVSSQVFESVPVYVQKILRLPCQLSDKPSEQPITEAQSALTDATKTAAVVVIAESAGYPALLLAPESRWAMVNVAALNTDGADAEKLNARVQKEVWRAFGYLMGAANSSAEVCLMKPVLSTADLDALPGKSLSPEPFNKILYHAQKLGIPLARMTTYRKAVEEGWAPTPTNDFQRAIWQELKK